MDGGGPVRDTRTPAPTDAKVANASRDAALRSTNTVIVHLPVLPKPNKPLDYCVLLEALAEDYLPTLLATSSMAASTAASTAASSTASSTASATTSATAHSTAAAGGAGACARAIKDALVRADRNAAEVMAEDMEIGSVPWRMVVHKTYFSKPRFAADLSEAVRATSPGVAARIPLYFHYPLKAHGLLPAAVSSSIGICTAVDPKALEHLTRKHLLSQHGPLQPYLPTGCGFEKLDAAAEEQVRSFVAENQVVIVKPSWGYAGQGILTSTDADTLIRHMKSLSRKYYEWRVEQYVARPLLYQGKKFHLGLYMMVVNRRNWKGCKAFFHDDQILVPALRAYNEGDWQVGEVHDTHASSLDYRCGSARQAFAKEFDAETCEKIQRNIATLCNAIKCVVEGADVRPPRGLEPELWYSFWRIDLMFERDFHPRLLELNSSPGVVYVEREYLGGLLRFIAQRAAKEYGRSLLKTEITTNGHPLKRKASDMGHGHSAPPNKREIDSRLSVSQLRTLLGPRAALSTNQTDAISTVALALSVNNADSPRLISTILEIVHPAALAQWRGSKGGIVNYAAEAGCSSSLGEASSMYCWDDV